MEPAPLSEFASPWYGPAILMLLLGVATAGLPMAAGLVELEARVVLAVVDDAAAVAALVALAEALDALLLVVAAALLDAVVVATFVGADAAPVGGVAVAAPPHAVRTIVRPAISASSTAPCRRARCELPAETGNIQVVYPPTALTGAAPCRAVHPQRWGDTPLCLPLEA